MFVTTHRPPLNANHPADCYGCHLNSITFDRGDPKKHVKNGDPWKDNPVVERIEELAATGRKNVAAFELKNSAAESAEQSVPPTAS